MRLKFDKITFKNTTYTLKEPLRVERLFYYDGWSIITQFDEFYGVGETIDEAIEDLYEDFHYLYKRLMELPDTRLGKHMLEMKEYFKSNVVKS